MKTCSKCKEAKELTAFGPHQKTKDRLASWCRKCHQALTKAYNQNNKEKVNKTNSEYRKNNPDKVRIWKKKDYEKNIDKIIVRQRKYYQANKETFHKKSKEWKANNKDKVRLSGQKRYLKNRERILKICREWTVNNRERDNSARNKRAKKDIQVLKPYYLKRRLTREGYSPEIVQSYPQLIDIKKLQIVTKRANKLLNQSNEKKPNHTYRN